MDIYEIMRELNEEYRNYAKTLAKYNVDLGSMANMQKEIDNGKYKVTCISEKYHRTASGNWQKKPYESETTEIDAKHYLNYVTSIPFFGDRVSKSYTKYGYIPTRLSCVSWGTGDTKAVREFKFESI